MAQTAAMATSAAGHLGHASHEEAGHLVVLAKGARWPAMTKETRTRCVCKKAGLERKTYRTIKVSWDVQLICDL